VSETLSERGVKAKVLKSDAMLLLAAAIWGFAFVAQRVGMSHVGPFTFNAVRFALGAAVLLPFALSKRSGKRRRGATQPLSNSKELLYAGGLTGCVLFAAASLQQVGIVSTTAGKAGFITGLYVVIVPLLSLLMRQLPSAGAWVGAALATAGLYMLSIRSGLRISLGDSLVLGSAGFFALHVLVIGWLARRMNPVRLAFLQFTTCSALSFVTAISIEAIALGDIAAAGIPILYAGMLSVGIAYTLQALSQREAPAAHAAIILSTEAVFAALGGSLFLGETLSSRGLIGCGLMLSGALVSKFSSLGSGRLPAEDLPRAVSRPEGQLIRHDHN
jgi:drug/metabolite transporter (DMT)-like permease